MGMVCSSIVSCLFTVDANDTDGPSNQDGVNKQKEVNIGEREKKKKKVLQSRPARNEGGIGSQDAVNRQQQGSGCCGSLALAWTLVALRGFGESRPRWGRPAGFDEKEKNGKGNEKAMLVEVYSETRDGRANSSRPLHSLGLLLFLLLREDGASAVLGNKAGLDAIQKAAQQLSNRAGQDHTQYKNNR
jgi:hypothetical protein